jgi:hypothetical protein
MKKLFNYIHDWLDGGLVLTVLMVCMPVIYPIIHFRKLYYRKWKKITAGERDGNDLSNV